MDYQNDVTAKDVRLAVREGFRSIEHVKRYTTNGMATDQGKLSNLHGLAIAAEVLGKPIPEVGLTTFRTPYTPVTFGTIAAQARGELFDPERRTPIDAPGASWPEERGAVFEPVGHWRRARYFPQGQETMDEAVARECRTVREKVGMFDASTLGKIEVVGPDAAAFLDRLYTNGWQKLAPGRAKYGIMLREDGLHLRRRRGGAAGRRPLPRHHHHRRRAPGAQPHGGLSPDRVPEPEGLADLHHGAMGHHRRAGAARARDRPALHVARPVGGRLRSYERRRDGSLRRAVPPVPHVVHRRARLRDQRSGRLRTGRLGRALVPDARNAAAAPTAPRRCTCCAPRRATSSSARTPTAR